MPKKVVDPNTGAVVFQLTPEERENERLKKRVLKLERRIDKLEKLLQHLCEVNKIE